MELWGGVECTFNRVHEAYHDQLQRSGHALRLRDLDQFAELGMTALRQPVLWELVSPNGLETADWSWPDKWLTRLRELRIRPIAGLVHHGSGPPHTNLLDPEFPEKLADYAAAVAERYPWIKDYTPVNEPLTTARFSALYGFWYPHATDDRSFVRALVHECRATILAMRAIRRHQPAARLVQTDDLGKTYSTPDLRYQADFDNHRRWLAWDLLCGHVSSEHPLHRYLLDHGCSASELAWFEESACPPDIIGINHYVTSDRFLDTHVERYPPETHGGNHRHRYADIAAARIHADGPTRPHELLLEAWERYRIPIALTEVHNGCTREEQLRWLLEMWRGAELAREHGADVRAVTTWALLGSFDWNSLVTREENFYEPGAFDIRGPQPRPTAIAHLAAQLTRGETPVHPLLQVPGWWRRPERLHHDVALTDQGLPAIVRRHIDTAHIPPILITGGRGTLGRAFARACLLRGIPHRILVRSELDIADRSSVRNALDTFRPWAIINTAGYVRVDDAEQDRVSCFRENTEGPTVLAEECAVNDIGLMTFSSDLVFDGNKSAHYLEPDTPSPLNTYGESKLLAEARVLTELPTALVIRTSAFFSPWDEYNFLYTALRTIASGRNFRAAADSTVSPTYVPDLVDSSLDLLVDGEHGIWHLANHGAISWADLATRGAHAAGLNPQMVLPCEQKDLKFAARRPLFSALGSCRTGAMPPLEQALSRYMNESTFSWLDEARAA